MSSAFSRIAKISLFAVILFFALGAGLWARGQSDRGRDTPPQVTETQPEAAEAPPQVAESPPEDGEAPPEDGETPPEAAGVPPTAAGTAPPVTETPAPVAEAPPQVKPEMTAEELAAAARNAEILDLDIKTSTLSELASWCRTLGLSEGGDREAMGNRLRDYFQLAQALAAGGKAATGRDSTGKVITIESAKSTEYFTIETVDEDYARLRGDVVISLKDGDSIHRITAWEILYNRTRNIMSANGGVVYIKESGDTIETFRGESITVDLDNWSSIFMNGVSERSQSEDETTYRFAGTVISRGTEEATVLSKATISNGSNSEALWSLTASKIWLLPGADFAILNGVLRVGEIPVLYIPAFFFPADEIIFHPVLGYRSREGSFLQTTTYILGRPKASSSSESSISKILGNSNDMEKVQHGIFLRSTGKKSRDPNDIRLSVLLDAYTNLGAYVGTELALPKKRMFGEYNLSLGAGFSRDIMQIPNNNVFTPFTSFDGTSTWNSTKYRSFDLPFRLRMTNTGSLGAKYGSVSWSLPFYSDPFVDRDFLDRSEEMDYVKMLKQGAAVEQADDETLAKKVLTSYEWRLSGSSNLSPVRLSPYISNVSISSLTSFLSFNKRSSAAYNNYAAELQGKLPSGATLNLISPSKEFFYPEKFTVYSISASIAGAPLSIGSAQSSPTKAPETSPETSPETETEPEPEPDPFKGLGIPNAPWKAAPDENANSGKRDTAELTPPNLSQRFDLPLSGGPRFSIAYQVKPTSATELQFRSNSTNWKESEDIDWSEISSLLTNIRGDGSVTFTLSDVNSIITNGFTFTGSGSWQKYGYINEDAEEYSSVPEGSPPVPDPAKINAAKIRAMGQTSFTTSWESTTTYKPFYLSPVWSSTNFQYLVKGLIAKSELEGTAGNNPDDAHWKIIKGKWDKENLDNHRASANFQALVINKNQNLSITADIPPEDSAFTGDAAMRIWISETSFNGKIRGKTETEKAKEAGITTPVDTKNKTVTFGDLFADPVFEPLRVTETLRFNNSFSVSQDVVYDPEEEKFTSTTSSLSLYGLTASFTATYSTTYSLEDTNPVADSQTWEWITSSDSSFSPREFKLGYNRAFKKDDLWKKRLSFTLGINTALTFNLQQFTKSEFTFDLKFTLGITKFLDITLGTNSANGSIYRYFMNTPLFDIPDGLPVYGETNLLKDLFNSIRFDDNNLRRQSGFKWKSFNLKLDHHLGDWNAKLIMDLAPYLTTGPGPREYKFNTEISFIVQWLPISEIKTEIIHDKDKFEFR
jgi:hypothetical protein